MKRRAKLEAPRRRAAGGNARSGNDEIRDGSAQRTIAKAFRGPLALLFVTCCLATTAFAHDPGTGYVELSLDGADASGLIDLAVLDLAAAVALDSNQDGNITDGELLARQTEMRRYLEATLAFRCDEREVPFRLGMPRERQRAVPHLAFPFAIRCAAPPRTLTVEYAAIFATGHGHQAVLTLHGGGHTETAVLTKPGAHTFALPTLGAQLWQFVALGFHHVLGGLDHVLFLVSLVLPLVLLRTNGTWQPQASPRVVIVRALGIATAFAVAHSLTLLVAAAGWWRPSPYWMEAAIALSVALVALNNVRPVVTSGAALAMGLGLVHGFGFAGALTDVGLARGAFVAAVFCFNIGIELAQIAIVGVLLSVTLPLRTQPAYPTAMRAVSLGIALVSLVWLGQRL